MPPKDCAYFSCSEMMKSVGVCGLDLFGGIDWIFNFQLARRLSWQDLVSIWGDVGGDSRGWGKEGEQTAGDRQPWVGGNPSPGGETNHPCHELVMRLQWKPHACTSPPVIGLASAINEIYNFHHMQGLKGICPMQIAWGLPEGSRGGVWWTTMGFECSQTARTRTPSS